MDTYLTLLKRWGFDISKENLLIPPTEDEPAFLVKNFGSFGNAPSRCLHARAMEVDASELEVHTTYVFQGLDCLEYCVNEDSEQHMQFKSAVSWTVLAEAFKNLESAANSIEQHLRVAALTMKIPGFAKADKRTGGLFQEKAHAYINAKFADLAGRELQYLAESYRLDFDPGLSPAYAEILTRDEGVRTILERAFTLIEGDVFKVPRFLIGSPSEVHLQAEDQDAGLALYDWQRFNEKKARSRNSHSLSFDIAAVFTPSAEITQASDEFEETLRVLIKDSPAALPFKLFKTAAALTKSN